MRASAALRIDDLPADNERIRVRLPVHYGASGEERSAFAENISEGGMYINTNEVYRVGDRLNLRIEFPEGTLQKRGEVVWAIRAPEHQRDALMCGMGISFADGDPAWPSFFRRWRDGLRLRR
jgi:uncharacterized protein (TIGR02266 family)